MNYVLTLPIGDYYYLGQRSNWKKYLKALRAGASDTRPIMQRARSGGFSISGLIASLIRHWHSDKPAPSPVDFGLLPVQPAKVTQSEIIKDLLGRKQLIKTEDLDLFDSYGAEASPYGHAIGEHDDDPEEKERMSPYEYQEAA